MLYYLHGNWEEGTCTHPKGGLCPACKLPVETGLTSALGQTDRFLPTAFPTCLPADRTEEAEHETVADRDYAAHETDKTYYPIP